MFARLDATQILGSGVFGVFFCSAFESRTTKGCLENYLEEGKKTGPGWDRMRKMLERHIGKAGLVTPSAFPLPDILLCLWVPGLGSDRSAEVRKFISIQPLFSVS